MSGMRYVAAICKVAVQTLKTRFYTVLSIDIYTNFSSFSSLVHFHIQLRKSSGSSCAHGNDTWVPLRCTETDAMSDARRTCSSIGRFGLATNKYANEPQNESPAPWKSSFESPVWMMRRHSPLLIVPQKYLTLRMHPSEIFLAHFSLVSLLPP